LFPNVPHCPPVTETFAVGFDSHSDLRGEKGNETHENQLPILLGIYFTILTDVPLLQEKIRSSSLSYIYKDQSMGKKVGMGNPHPPLFV
jgi:hypothetical protein